MTEQKRAPETGMAWRDQSQERLRPGSLARMKVHLKRSAALLLLAIAAAIMSAIATALTSGLREGVVYTLGGIIAVVLGILFLAAFIGAFGVLGYGLFRQGRGSRTEPYWRAAGMLPCVVLLALAANRLNAIAQPTWPRDDPNAVLSTLATIAGLGALAALLAAIGFAMYGLLRSED